MILFKCDQCGKVEEPSIYNRNGEAVMPQGWYYSVVLGKERHTCSMSCMDEWEKENNNGTKN